MASFFDTNPNAALLSQIGQNTARASQAGTAIGDNISQVGSVFSNFAKQQDADRQRGIDNEVAARRLAIAEMTNNRAAEQQLFNNALNDPNSPEFKALKTANLKNFEEEQKIKNRLTPKKPVVHDMYKILPDGGVQSVKVTGDQAAQFGNSGFTLGTYKAPSGKRGSGKGTTATNNAKAAQEISKIIGSSGNPDDISEAYNAWKKAGKNDSDFLNQLYQIGGGSLDNKGFFDFGNKDLDAELINVPGTSGNQVLGTPTTSAQPTPTSTVGEPSRSTGLLDALLGKNVAEGGVSPLTTTGQVLTPNYGVVPVTDAQQKIKEKFAARGAQPQVLEDAETRVREAFLNNPDAILKNPNIPEPVKERYRTMFSVLTNAQ